MTSVMPFRLPFVLLLIATRIALPIALRRTHARQRGNAMSVLLYGLLAVLLVLYAIGFLYETVMSFRRFLLHGQREIYP